MPRPNWFFGFPLAGTFVLELPRAPGALRVYHPDDVHLTLAFLGGCGEAAAQRALAALDERLAELQPRAVDASLGAVVPMGPPRRYSALSALLVEGREQMTALLSALRDVLADAAAVTRDERAPKPHVTLARPKHRATPGERRDGLTWAASLDLAHVRARLDRVALYTWSERRDERLFRVMAERRLPPARPGA